MQEVQPAIWWWTAPHPDWTPESGGPDGWGQDVSCYALDDGERLLLFDPLAPPGLVDELAAGREPVVVLTCPWHRRDVADVVARLGAQVYVPAPDARDPDPVQGHVFAAGDRLPIGVDAFAGREPNDLALWVASRGVLVLGDTLIGRDGGRLELTDRWLPRGVTRDEVLTTLRPLLDLPIELVLPTHGEPTDKSALERALA